MTDTPTFNYSYMITNRKLDSQVPYNWVDEVKPFTDTPANGLYFFSASGSYTNSSTAFTLDESSGSDPQTTWPTTFLENLKADLGKTSQSNPSLTLYIHGMGDDWSVATNSSMQFGQALQKGYSQYATSPPTPPTNLNCQYNGLLIGFSWPSLDPHDSIERYGAYNPETGNTETKPNIRANILGSLQSFATLMTLLSDLATQVSGLTINIICHSEGNYMMMEGMQNLSNSSTSVSIQQAILLAADINNGALQEIDSSSSKNDLTTGISAGPGSGKPIATLINPVAVFYSNNDTILDDSFKDKHFKKFHNQSYLHRLGRQGPSTFAPGTLMAGVRGVDCSTVASGSADEDSTPLGELYKPGWIPPNEETGSSDSLDPHGSYRFVPQILWVISQLLASGGSFATLPYDVTQKDSTEGSYVMSFDAPPTA